LGNCGTAGNSGASRINPPVFFFWAAKGWTSKQANKTPSR
jgi:hypothetical protein